MNWFIRETRRRREIIFIDMMQRYRIIITSVGGSLGITTLWLYFGLWKSWVQCSAAGFRLPWVAPFVGISVSKSIEISIGTSIGISVLYRSRGPCCLRGTLLGALLCLVFNVLLLVLERDPILAIPAAKAWTRAASLQHNQLGQQGYIGIRYCG